MNNPQRDSIGVIFELTIEEDGNAIDISAATTMEINFKKPDAVILNQTATFTTDGTDGKIQYISVSGDLDVIGIWSMQGYLVMPGFDGYTSVVTFRVLENL